MSGGQVGCRRVEMKIGLLSDAHGNREALERAFEVLEQAKAARVYFMGDAIGYLPGVAALESLAGRNVPCLRGNHEDMLLTGNWSVERDEHYQFSETRAVMSPELLRTIESWPTSRRIQFPIGPALMCHGSPDCYVHGYVYEDTDLARFDVPSGTTVFMGNTHRPFIRRHAGVTYVNVGSCGMPRDRGDLGAVCLFDIQSGSVRIIRFDIAQQNAAAIRRCGDVSQAVAEVFARRSSNVCFGELHEG